MLSTILYFTGGHTQLFIYMMENFPSLELTKTACRDFPEVIGEFIRNFFVPVRVTSNQNAGADDDDDDVFQAGVFVKNYICPENQTAF